MLNFEQVGNFYVPTCPIFAGPVTYRISVIFYIQCTSTYLCNSLMGVLVILYPKSSGYAMYFSKSMFAIPLSMNVVIFSKIVMFQLVIYH